MCIIHDLGECFTGDILFDKNETQAEWKKASTVTSIAENYAVEMQELSKNVELKTIDKIYKLLMV